MYNLILAIEIFVVSNQIRSESKIHDKKIFFVM